jgi:flagellin-like protein
MAMAHQARNVTGDRIGELVCAERGMQEHGLLSRRCRRNRRAVSQVIAALLLVAIAVSAAILLYVFSIGLIGGLQTGGGEQVRQQLIMEAYDWTALGTLKIWVRNIGATEIVLGDMFVNGLAVNFVIPTECNNTFKIQQSCRIIINQFLATITPGITYSLRIVTIDGAVFSYPVTAGNAQ